MSSMLKKVHGILLLNKPLHLTSNAALQRIKHLYQAKKAGHTGSLDPLATGMLPICFGEATKVSQFLLDSNKEYAVQARLGIQTSTGDAEGAVIATKPLINITRERITHVLGDFLGTIQQIPPMFSALKHQGRPLYELARKGVEVERQPRTVQIYELQLTSFMDDTFSVLVRCSKGTYIRTLIEDIGAALNCCAYVSQLHRVAVAPYQQNKMYTLDELQQYDHATLLQCLLPMDTSLQNFPIIRLSSAATFYLRTGQPVRIPDLPTEGLVRLFSDNAQFMGIGEVLEDGRVAPRRLLAC